MSSNSASLATAIPRYRQTLSCCSTSSSMGLASARYYVRLITQPNRLGYVALRHSGLGQLLSYVVTTSSASPTTVEAMDGAGAGCAVGLPGTEAGRRGWRLP